MSTIAPSLGISGPALVLRRLYLARFGFALVWALLLAATGSTLGAAAVTLLVLYPLADVAAAVVDARATRGSGPVVNAVVSLVAAAGIAIACTSGIPAVLRVWGTWAIVSGLIQLVVGLGRRRLGGQWPMMISGAVSALAGTAFIAMASQDGAALTGVAGYAVGGGVLFLVSALRLGRSSTTRA